MRKKVLVDNIWFHFRDSNIGIKTKRAEEVCPITWSIFVGIVSNTWQVA